MDVTAVTGGFRSQVFVGRDSQLAALKEIYENVQAGRSAVVTIGGEPGIGKTALCEQLATLVAASGRSVVGHCYEEYSLPYLSFVEALSVLVHTLSPEEFEIAVGSNGPKLAQLIPELRRSLPVAGSPLLADPEAARWDLFEAVAGFITSIAEIRPLIIVLEDLHWADRGTLELLLHVSRALGATSPQGPRPRLLFLVTYRDVEVDEAHPLAATLAGLVRLPFHFRLSLRGLDPADVQRLLSVLAGRNLSRDLTDEVNKYVEGNPLFAHEIARYLSQQDLPFDRLSWRTNTESGQLGVQGGLRQVISRRLSRLSRECRSVLSLAAVIGRDFRLEVLGKVASLPEDDLAVALTEATAASITDERTEPGGHVRYRFSHALFQRVLYNELSAPQRVHLHQHVGRALEALSGDHLDEQAADLAEHFSHSSEAADLLKAVEYGEKAAKQAMAVYAYSDAVRLLDRAIEVHSLSAPGEASKHCDLLLALAEALVAAGELRRASEDVTEQAFRLAEEISDENRASRACQVALLTWFMYGSGTQAYSPRVRPWAERADRYARPGTVQRAIADGAMSDVLYAENRRAEAATLRRRALGVARNLGEPEPLFRAALSILRGFDAPEREDERRALADEFSTRPREGVSERTLSHLIWFAARAFLNSGERDRAEALWREVDGIVARTRDGAISQFPLQTRLYLAVLDGRFEAAREAAAQLLALATEMGRPSSALSFITPQTLRPLIYLGREEEALRMVNEAIRLSETDSRWLGGLRRLCQAYLRQKAPETPVGPRVEEVAPDTPFPNLVVLLETAIVLNDEGLVASAERRLAPFARFPTGYAPLACVARLLGRAATLLGEADRARAYFLQAIEACTRIRSRPDLALAHLDLAQLLFDRFPDQRLPAKGHLDFAIAELGDLKMKPALEQAQQLADQQRLRPVHPDGLSEREMEVLRLIAAGKTNRQISEELYISLNTVSHHVTNLFAKTGAVNRTEAGAYAHRNGLV